MQKGVREDRLRPATVHSGLRQLRFASPSAAAVPAPTRPSSRLVAHSAFQRCGRPAAKRPHHSIFFETLPKRHAVFEDI